MELASLAQENIWFKQQVYENEESWCQKVAVGTAEVSVPSSRLRKNSTAVQVTELQVGI